MIGRGINKVILIGYLGKDPEIRYMPNGMQVAQLTLATTDSWKDKQTGDRREITEWHKIVIFGKLASIAEEFLKKGSQIYIEGQLRTRKWQDSNGKNMMTTEVIVNMHGTMQIIGKKQHVAKNNNTLTEESNEKNIKSWTESKIIKKEADISEPKFMEIKRKNQEIDDISQNFDDEIPF